MKKTLCLLPGLLVLAALAGCCANDTCSCDDDVADALYFSFALGGPQGFAAADVDTFYLIRTSHPDPATNVMATSESKRLVIPLTNNSFTAADNTIVISNIAPFASAGSNTKLNAYDYRLVTYRVDQVAGKKVRTSYVFKINNIQLAGRYDANGCCTCYANTGKQFDANTVGTDTLTGVATRVVTAPALQPIYTQLAKTR